MQRFRVEIMMAGAVLLALGMMGCGGPDRCRGAAVETLESSCSVSVQTCESESTYDAYCDNDTFSGEFECSCYGAGLFSVPGEFTSAELCGLDEQELLTKVVEGCGWNVEIVPRTE